MGVSVEQKRNGTALDTWGRGGGVDAISTFTHTASNYVNGINVVSMRTIFESWRHCTSLRGPTRVISNGIYSPILLLSHSNDLVRHRMMIVEFRRRAWVIEIPRPPTFFVARVQFAAVHPYACARARIRSHRHGGGVLLIQD